MTPLECAEQSDEGLRMVMGMIDRLEQGVYF